MDWSGIQARLQEGEGHQTEFKRSVDLKATGRALSAFANSEGGVLVLGVDDGGAVVGVTEDAETLSERLTSFLQNGLSAPVQARLGRAQVPEGWVHWVEVTRQRGFEPLRYGGIVYVRRGRASVEPSPAELAELYNAYGYIVTEERAISAAKLDDIDVSAFAGYLRRLGLDFDAEPRIALEDDLRARGVLTPQGEALSGTVYGVLAFGRIPQGFAQTQNFFVQCVSYAGASRADEVLQVADAKGRLDEQLDRTLGWLAGLPRREVYAGATRTDIPHVPLAAAREIVVNAIAHRDYAIMGSKILVEQFVDRVEFTSPGALPNGLTPTSVMRGGNPRARNQSMTNYLMAMGKMEQRGRGWPIVTRAMEQHNGTRPIFEEDRDARWIRVTLSTHF